MNTKKRVLIIGAGPAGLAAAYEFVRQKKLDQFDIEIFEAESNVGGLSKTLTYKGFKFDIGGHRFYTKLPEVENFYKIVLGKDLLRVSLPKRIYYENKLFHYPLSVTNALLTLGPLRSVKVVISWFLRQLNPYKNEKNFEEWVTNRFGDELYKTFFKTYSEKIWGMSMKQLSSDWAAQRIENFNLIKALINAITKRANAKTVITSFDYPSGGAGMFYEKIKEIVIKSGVKIHLKTPITKLNCQRNKIIGLSSKTKYFTADYVISTMPFDKLIQNISSSPTIKKAAQSLKFNQFITVNLIVKPNPMPYQCVYVHDPKINVGRIEDFYNWSKKMSPSRSVAASITLEYFTSGHDANWQKTDKELLSQAKDEITQTGLIDMKNILDGFVYRTHDVYPIYNLSYKRPLETCKQFVKKFSNLQLCGRGGLFRYNNMDHSMLTGFYVARNIINGKYDYDVWRVNDDPEYVEEK